MGTLGGIRVMPWVKCLRVVSAALSPGSAPPAESRLPLAGEKAGETAGRFLVRVQKVRTYRYAHTRTYVVTAFPSGAAESRDLSQALPPASGLRASTRGDASDCTDGTSLCLGPSARLPDGEPGRLLGLLSLLSQRQRSESGSG